MDKPQRVAAVLESGEIVRHFKPPKSASVTLSMKCSEQWRKVLRAVAENVAGRALC
jgi:hypothetical protein